MTAEERRVVEALQAHTGGLTVTDQDIHHAQRQLHETLETTPTRASRGPFLLAAAAAIVLIAGVVGFVSLNRGEEAAQPSGQDDSYDDFLTGADPTPERLQGVWRVDAEDGATLFVRFQPPNRYSMAGPEGVLFDDPAIEGTYVIEGERITVNVDPGSRQCGGLRFAMLASVPAPNVAHLVSVGRASDDCSSPEGTRTILQQLLPTHPEPAGWGPPQKGDVDWPPAGWQVPERGTALHGDWLMEGGGYLLEVNPDGNYHVADDSGQPIDSGDWTLRDGELTLVSGSGSTACSAGDRLVQGVELVLAYHGPGIADTPFMRTTVQRDECGEAWAGAGWMKY